MTDTLDRQLLDWAKGLVRRIRDSFERWWEASTDVP